VKAIGPANIQGHISVKFFATSSAAAVALSVDGGGPSAKQQAARQSVGWTVRPRQ
jgi:hypothetical protein